jgi:hypothetical protein
VALAAFAPVVVHDSGDGFPLASVADARVAAPGLGQDRGPAVYGRAVPREGGGAWLQYWMFYPGQDQDRGILRTGRHEGDWELIQLRVDERGRPKEAVYAQHSGAERCPWSAVERRDGHPVVYSAHGSHASYLRAGVRDRMWPDPNDEARGGGRVVRPRVVRVSAESPAWMRWPGRWGGARARWWVPGEQSSPHGPAFQPDGRWSDPEGWANAARDCQAHCNRVGECDGGETALGAGGVAAVAGAAVLGLRRRRRRRDRPRA